MSPSISRVNVQRLRPTITLISRVTL